MNYYDNSTPERICTRCKEPFPATLEYFYACKTGKYGLHSKCKRCYNLDCKEYQKTHPEIYSLANINKSTRYRTDEEYREKIKKLQREKYRTDERYREKIKQRYKYKYKSYSLLSEKEKNIRRKHARLAWHKRRSLHYKNGGYFTEEQIHQLYLEQEGKCFYCNCDLNGVFQRDHYIPVSKGGTSWIENIRLSCRPCNASKGDKLPSEWISPYLQNYKY